MDKETEDYYRNKEIVVTRDLPTVVEISSDDDEDNYHQPQPNNNNYNTVIFSPFSLTTIINFNTKQMYAFGYVNMHRFFFFS